MTDHDLTGLMKAATERQLAVTQLQEKYAHSDNASAAQLVLDMRDLLATERVVLDEIITLFAGMVQAAPPQLAAAESS